MSWSKDVLEFGVESRIAGTSQSTPLGRRHTKRL
jgi:hypothetical protein